MQLQSPSDVEAEVSYGEASQRYLQVLRQAIHDAEKPQDQLQPFFPDIGNLQNEISVQQLRFHFYSALKLTKRNWIPKGNIENVIRASVNRQCEKSDITIDFYRHGGIRAVIALYLATKDYNWVFAQMEALSEEWRKILIEEVKRIKVNDLIPAWIGTCDRSPIREDEELPRLNRHAKEKTGAKRQRSRPASFSNNQRPAPSLGSQQPRIPHPLSHENVPQYQIQPQISQEDHIPPPAPKHPHNREDGGGIQQTHVSNSRVRVSLPINSQFQHNEGPQQILPHQPSQHRHGCSASQVRQCVPVDSNKTETDHTQDRGHRQNLTINHENDGAFGIDEQRYLTVPGGSVHHPSLRNEHENPDKENREMKYMYTNAPASNISKMPELFRTAIKNSRLWNWERSQELKTTGCWPSLFPKDHTQDVSFTIWCGNEDGERLADFFGAQLEISS